MEAELEDLEGQLRNTKSVPAADKLIKYLRLVRELHIRDSPTVARYGNLLLRNYKGQLSEDEMWQVYEQVAVAALDCHALAFAASLIKAINRRFPDSVRAGRLQGMYYEASGDWESAERVYKDILSGQPANEMGHKRLIALERTKGNLTGAIDALKKYLDTFGNDKDGWEELAEMYLEATMLRQAAFCYEELITISPTSSNYLVRYADILYTLGGPSNFKTARAYYAKAVEVTGGTSLRALWGICACSANITDKVALQDARSRAQIELPEVTVQALLRLYQESAPDKLKLVNSTLQKQGLV